MVNFIGIIPSRFSSTRFPGKPLVDIKGKPMIQRVYEQARKALDRVVVATDDQRIYDTVKNFGGEVVMTSKDHQSGTDRCAEAAAISYSECPFDVVINIQGDEPFIDLPQIEQIKNCFSNQETDIATLITPITDSSILFDSNKVKVVKGLNDRAIYFSRSPIPFLRGYEQSTWVEKHPYYMHIGMYAYRFQKLMEVTELAQTPLELVESLEQLRWLENGYIIQTAITHHTNFGVDTPEDLENLLKNSSLLFE